MRLAHLLPAVTSTVQPPADLQTLGMVTITGIPSAARPATIASLAGRHEGPVLVVSPRIERAETMATLIGEYLPSDRTPQIWRTPDGLPYEQLPFDADAASDRVTLLDHLLDDRSPLIIATARGLAQRSFGPDVLRTMRRDIRPGARIAERELLGWLVDLGYQVVPLVNAPGTVARRGGVIDIYPPNFARPVRLDLFGDEVESIRTFDATTQRSTTPMDRLTILPPTDLPLWDATSAADAARAVPDDALRPEVQDEWRHLIQRLSQRQLSTGIDLFSSFLLGSASATLLDYLPSGALVILDDPSAIDRAGTTLESHGDELYASLIANQELPAGLPRPITAWSDVATCLERFPRVAVGADDASDNATIEVTGLRDAPLFAGRLQTLIQDLTGRVADGWSVQVVTDQVRRVTTLLEQDELFPRRQVNETHGPAPIEPGVIDVRQAEIDGGWEIADRKLLVLTDLELFGFRKAPRRQGRRRIAENARFAESLTPGEYVVHVDHGVGRFTGLTRVENGGVEREYLLLEYARGDKLYVPVDQSDRVTRYGSGGLEPSLTKLGSGEWVRTKQRVRRAVREMAFELLQLYAARESKTGHRFPPDAVWDAELANAFSFQETTDQLRAIEDVKSDMESDKPMDRLVCGDVGFGKTEVALRAAFKAVNDGHQVAILVPTTVLSLQHFTTFSQRLAAFPVRVEMLSRLRDKREQRDVVAGLADGTVDIVIGTHRLVQRDVRFKRLGLVVIDEEQRFGVRHKEFLKRLRTEVDVLTMTATPIPRTLHLSLTGIRDISIIDTAPNERVPIRTFVTPAKDELIREVILRELDRGGQVYYVHNRVRSIDRQTAHLQKLVPEARFGVGHGQMDEEVLEDVIVGFVRRDFDVLVCTTIIESGIDISNVNTIVIDHANRFGLTQLYQLRGRVGRSTQRAYAYLLYPPDQSLSEEADARLTAIQEATELGAGLRVAMRDMEIRGAGNILGAEQSGHIADVGYDLYLRLLSQAVEEVREGRPAEEEGVVTLDLPITALLPAGYITDVELRLNTYRRIAAVDSRGGLELMRQELKDRFGPIPDEVDRLLALISLRIRCAELGIESVIEREREIVIRPVTVAPTARKRLETQLGGAIRFTANSARIRVTELSISWEAALDAVLDSIDRAQAA